MIFGQEHSNFDINNHGSSHFTHRTGLSAIESTIDVQMEPKIAIQNSISRISSSDEQQFGAYPCPSTSQNAHMNHKEQFSIHKHSHALSNPLACPVHQQHKSQLEPYLHRIDM